GPSRAPPSRDAYRVGPAPANTRRNRGAAGLARTACTPRNARLRRENSPRRMAIPPRSSWLGQDELQGVEPALHFGELIEAPSRPLLQQRDRGPDDATRVPRVLGGLEHRVQLPHRRQPPARAPERAGVHLQNPRTLGLGEPVQERG